MGNFSKNKVYSLFLIFFISFYLFFPSLHALDKYLTTPFKTLLISFYYLLYFISFIVFYFYLRKKKWFVSILSSPVLLFFLLLFLFVLSYLLFDYQLYLQEFEKRGSDASDAMIKAGTNLLQGSHPYLEKTYLKNPISPGPGWILMNLFFANKNSYFLLNPFYITLSSFCVYQLNKSYYDINCYLLLLFSSLSFWEVVGIATDTIGISCAIFVISFLIYRYWNISFFVNFLLIFFLGLITTARINLIYLPILLAFPYYKKNKKSFISLSAMSLFVAFACHFVFYLESPNTYHPIHLRKKVGLYFDIYALSFILILLLPVFSVFKDKYTDISRNFRTLFLGLAIPMWVLSINALRGANWQGKDWGDPFYYLVFTFPLFLAWLISMGFFLDLSSDANKSSKLGVP